MAESIIQILPEKVASQIAAGEVVERPGSAVKELVENALDAGARSIEVAIERGGCALIAVSDDGSGMSRADAALSLRRHATSKIRDANDLGAIRTLGFRGEALASIASVARLRLYTRRAADSAGIEIVAEGGQIAATGERAMAPGTRIEVRELFFNTPARLKFLKSEPAEQAAVAEPLQRLALANHAVAFSLRADQRIVFDLPRATSVRERLRQLFGDKLAARMLGFETRRGGVRVFGLLSMSQESFASARMVFTFVNGRAVRDKLLLRAVAQSYQTLLPRGRHPAVAVFVELGPEQVDVNVHPMKTEVRFRNSGAVFEAVYHALRERLADQTAGEMAVDDRVPELERAASSAGETAAAVSLGSARSAMAELPARTGRPLRLVADSGAPPAATQSPLGLGFSALASPVKNGTGSEANVPMYSRLRIIGQLFAGYIALENDDGMLLLDQHAAHERVTFERLKAELRSGGVRVQTLLTPHTLELSPARAALAVAALPELRAMGFDAEPFGPAALLVTGSPAVFGAEGGAKLLADMIDSLGEGGVRRGKEAPFEDLLKQLACHGSVRVGRVLARSEIDALLAELDRTEFKTNCPHGRPVHIRFPRGQIERMFRR
ncbi:MAG TPA: DNA mismatch repair endonuclease MutL [Candidatus Binataceae bacterium]|nr:DNA mismatch repair endonuclease MutL [Candidatus Binataceae bacterium]